MSSRTLILVVLLAGCGGSGGSGSPAVEPAPAATGGHEAVGVEDPAPQVDGSFPDVRVDGVPEEERTQVLQRVDEALRAHGDLGVYGDLRDGLEALSRTHVVHITVEGGHYYVDAGPRDDVGHDFGFGIDATTLELGDVTVGEVEPPPGD